MPKYLVSLGALFRAPPKKPQRGFRLACTRLENRDNPRGGSYSPVDYYTQWDDRDRMAPYDQPAMYTIARPEATIASTIEPGDQGVMLQKFSLTGVSPSAPVELTDFGIVGTGRSLRMLGENVVDVELRADFNTDGVYETLLAATDEFDGGKGNYFPQSFATFSFPAVTFTDTLRVAVFGNFKTDAVGPHIGIEMTKVNCTIAGSPCIDYQMNYARTAYTKIVQPPNADIGTRAEVFSQTVGQSGSYPTVTFRWYMWNLGPNDADFVIAKSPILPPTGFQFVSASQGVVSVVHADKQYASATYAQVTSFDSTAWAYATYRVTTPGTYTFSSEVTFHGLDLNMANNTFAVTFTV